MNTVLPTAPPTGTRRPTPKNDNPKDSMPSPGLRAFAWSLACFVFLLVIAGGLVTSTGSALAVPDWPLSYGKLFPPMVGGILYEHGHRMIATTAGFLTVILAILLWRRQGDKTLKWLGVSAVGVVCLQGFLGGMTVLFRLPAVLSVGHACLGQTYFCVMVSIAVLSSSPVGDPHVSDDTARIRRLSILTVAFIFLQLLWGAILRHTGNGLHWHWLGATLVVIHVFLLARRVDADPEQRPELRGLSFMLAALVGVQLVLGYFSWKNPLVSITTTHVANGALIYATAVILALQAHRQLIPSLRVATVSQ